ncbi:MAG: hypothetical protein ACOYZ7_03970 [Chloroflexota bacterium]
MRDKRGAELVEAAATLSVVLMLILSLIGFGWDLYAWRGAGDQILPLRPAGQP